MSRGHGAGLLADHVALGDADGTSFGYRMALADRVGIARDPTSRAVFFVCYVALVLLVAEASFAWFERPFLALKDHWRARPAERLRASPAPDA